MIHSVNDVAPEEMNAASLALVEARGSLKGIEYLQKVITGEIPQSPFNSMLGIRLVEATEGRVVAECDVRADHFNKGGTGHGGFLSTLCDNACGMALDSVSDEGVSWTTMDLQVRFHKAVRPDATTLRTVGTVIKAGRQVGVTQAEVRTIDGALIATATSSLHVVPKR